MANQYGFPSGVFCPSPSWVLFRKVASSAHFALSFKAQEPPNPLTLFSLTPFCSFPPDAHAPLNSVRYFFFFFRFSGARQAFCCEGCSRVLFFFRVDSGRKFRLLMSMIFHPPRAASPSSFPLPLPPLAYSAGHDSLLGQFLFPPPSPGDLTIAMVRFSSSAHLTICPPSRWGRLKLRPVTIIFPLAEASAGSLEPSLRGLFFRPFFFSLLPPLPKTSRSSLFFLPALNTSPPWRFGEVPGVPGKPGNA